MALDSVFWFYMEPGWAQITAALSPFINTSTSEIMENVKAY